MRKKILLTEKIIPAGLELLASRDDVELITAPDTKEATLVELAKDANAIAVRMAIVSSNVINSAEHLEIVSRHGVGCDNIDVEAMNARQLPVAIAAGSNDRSVAESTLMMLLATSRNFAEQDRAVRQGRYAERNPLSGNDCRGRHVLVIGFGRTGKSTAQLCQAIGMQVTVTDIELDKAAADAMGVNTVDDWRSLLPSADFVTVHVPLNESTHHMIAENELASMPKGGIVVNCARGGVVSEKALCAALDSGHIASAGLDVYEDEPPPPDYPLFARNDIILTPHTAGTSRQALDQMSCMTIQNILDHFDGKPLTGKIFNERSLS